MFIISIYVFIALRNQTLYHLGHTLIHCEALDYDVEFVEID